jgi:hypothetical protein
MAVVCYYYYCIKWTPQSVELQIFRPCASEYPLGCTLFVHARLITVDYNDFCLKTLYALQCTFFYLLEIPYPFECGKAQPKSLDPLSLSAEVLVKNNTR